MTALLEIDSDPQAILDGVPDGEWHSIMSQSSDVHYEQTAIYTAEKTGEQSSHMLAQNGSETMGGARVGLFRVPVLNRGLALVRFGPFWRKRGAELDRDIYRKTIRSLIEEYCTGQKFYLIVRPRPHPEFYPMEAALLEEMGVHGSQSSKLDHYFVNVALSEEEQSKSLDKKWRYNLKTGLANGLEISIGDSAADISAFQKIYSEMVQRKHLNYPGVGLPNVIPDLVQLPEQMKMRIALAHHQGVPVAGVAFSIVGDLAYYVFGATNDRATEMQAGFVLQWHVINWLRENGGVRWCDLGGTGDPGIQHFKKGLAGKQGAFLAAEEFHYSPDVTATMVVKGLFALRNVRNRIQRWQRER